MKRIVLISSGGYKGLERSKDTRVAGISSKEAVKRRGKGETDTEEKSTKTKQIQIKNQKEEIVDMMYVYWCWRRKK